MLSMLRSNLYRLVKTRFTGWFVVVYLLFIGASALSVMIIGTNTGAPSDGMVRLDITAAEMYGRSLASGAILPICASIFIANYLSADFKTMSIKNVLQAKGGRVSYVVAAAMTILVVCIAFVIIGSVGAEVTFRAFGFSISGYNANILVPLACQVVLVSGAYSSIVALIVFASGSETLGVVAALLVSSGFLESMMRMLFSNIFSGTPVLRDCLDGYLGAQVELLSWGAVSDAGGFIAAAATFAIAIAVGVFVMKRRELAQ